MVGRFGENMWRKNYGIENGYKNYFEDGGYMCSFMYQLYIFLLKLLKLNIKIKYSKKGFGLKKNILT